MSIEHHHEDPEFRKNVETFFKQLTGDHNRAWPHGRINGEDDGATAYAIAADPKNQVVIIRFPKPMDWIGLDIPSAIALRDKVDEKIKELSSPKSG